MRPDRGLPPPDGLLDFRQRDRLTRLGAGWPEPGRMGLPVSGQRRDSAIAAGARVEPDGRVSIGRAQAVHAPMQPYVPFLARREIVPVSMEPIPASSWGGSLQNLLTEESWDRLRRPRLTAAGGICQVCGEGSGGLECHEIWEYITPGSEVVWGVQTLRALLVVCDGCHAMFHPGLVQGEGDREALRHRVMAVNGWTEDEERAFSDWSGTVTRLRSRYRWLLDFSALPVDIPIEVDERYWMPDPEFGGVMADHDRLGRIRAKILGASWALDGVVRQTEKAEPYVERAESSVGVEDADFAASCRHAGQAEMRWQGLSAEEWVAIAHHAGEMQAGRIDIVEFRKRALRWNWDSYVVWIAGILAGRGLMPQDVYAEVSIEELAGRGDVAACMEGAEAEFMRMCREKGYLTGAMAA
jgi:hypothetical protein